MRMLVQGIVAAGTLAVLSAPAGAFWLDAFCEYVHDGYEQNRRWPSPYLCPDRKHAHAPFDTMVRNGWRRQNLLGAHHFNEDATKLTQAGELKVRWIMSQAPPQYRRVFVEQSIVAGETEQRIASVNDFAQRVAEVSGTAAPGMMAVTPPQVVASHLVSEGRPAPVVDYVNTQFRDNMRVPMLPTSTGGETGQ
ncbi:MAG: hypothetical protein AAGJ46_07870 [Planctomycetota bacterium]